MQRASLSQTGSWVRETGRAWQWRPGTSSDPFATNQAADTQCLQLDWTGLLPVSHAKSLPLQSRTPGTNEMILTYRNVKCHFSLRLHFGGIIRWKDRPHDRVRWRNAGGRTVLTSHHCKHIFLFMFEFGYCSTCIPRTVSQLYAELWETEATFCLHTENQVWWDIREMR